MSRLSKKSHVVALSGGVGGAKLALGLSRVLEPGHLTVIANTADDFEHLGLMISPDVDTLLYTLAGINNSELGWGQAGETWQCMQMLGRIGGETWFRLGDRDLAIHLFRTQLLKQDGCTLTHATSRLREALGIDTFILPMCDQGVATMVQTIEGELPFQHYFVREQCRPVVSGFRFDGIERAALNPQIVARCAETPPECIVLCPSNPYVSVEPILALPGMRDFLKRQSVPIVAVSPIVGGDAIKGPAAKMMRELQIEPSVISIARHYAGFIDALLIDPIDERYALQIAELGIRPIVTNTVMHTLAEREQLASDVLVCARKIDI